MLPWSYEYYKKQLNVRSQNYYGNLLFGLNSQKEKVFIPGVGVRIEEMSNVFEAIMLDHPEIFWVNGYDGYKCLKSIAFSQIEVDSFFTPSEIKKWKHDADKWRYEVCSQIPENANELARIWMLYDYLARQVTYGFSELRYSQTIIGSIKKGFHMSVCEGIAKSFKYLCDYAGINCIVVHGYLYTGTGNGNHAWNVVEYNGKKYHIDVTAELDHAKFHSKADSNSFLKSSRDMHEYRWDNNVVKL